ncbi:NAD(P)-dependent oxidoreductase [Puniceibacterium sp. IMCC21224]|uniref:NAD(P)-dependent oxidoreductase n=1 Tax=Puniceibacterium sp. IMCC21224 TaxID=1618204 RepID=UPI00064DAD5B|nr:NAD(P)-dependent oxidoreductase [Puniceibacterium sp. IMCC21224]KMK65320.1 beta-hydroxyacid dehydrogenase, 3-hydroxyisobutyrate dehydrogenase [Puniceibacterium sp. IMCC21224]
MNTQDTIGFVGLGVMGGPMCQNMARKHHGKVLAFDLSEDALVAVEQDSAERVASLVDLAQASDIIFLSLPGDPQVDAVTTELLNADGKCKIVVDLSTTSVAAARAAAAKLGAAGIRFADAPVARTREAAQKGALSIMVGADQDLFDRIKPHLEYIATDITHGGKVGTGQVLKLVNNMLVFANTVAMAEMMVLGEAGGVDPEVLLDAVSKGSGDSFVLRNHARKAMLPRAFPDRAFSPEYVLKDIGGVFALAQSTGVDLPAAETVQSYYEAAVKHGYSGRYFPCVVELVEKGLMRDGTPKKEES